MRMALALAGRCLGRVAPNPAVGAVLVRNGRVLGRGVTGPGGRPHAEAVALSQAKLRYGDDALVGATAYVSLEPCAHHGHTPPCAEALIAAGIARVVCPISDPDPRVDGRGFSALRSAGISVETGGMEAEAQALNSGFLSVTLRGRPHVTLKLATTLDGRIATSSGESRWITGAEARRRVHLMRAQADAVLIGAGTARADDPMLDVRGFGDVIEGGHGIRQPIRVIADGSLSLPLEGRLVQSARQIPVQVLYGADASDTRKAALEAAGVQAAPVAADRDGRLDLGAALGTLAKGGITRLLCEGGGQLAASLLAGGLVDELVLFSAGKVIGGDGMSALGPLGLARLGEAPMLGLISEAPVGDDVMSIWRPV